ncbi:S1-C subfamily serine protease [Keratinibaculum paraultunense]|uniref:S1-C subfamily serine protease n=1 Tax=Keratinibaculum paraultunense TaxID=1278232 RepID=A0A4R3KQU1_9FIRM|nr:trypsin-like peptidase domain-containing protein [Keratinibaculum paraultunense]QQY79734.1 trypsin-like peptidase domain-containing protein [Keratinibaculum paraultunense]TCS86957.1 S1-C subfamily serine protease [Keratinibaculum paraultunense]
MYYERPPKKRGFFSYFIVALIAAIVGGIISAYIAPTYLYGKVLPVPGNYDGKAPYNTGQQINITPSDDISSVEAVAKKAMSSVVGITTVQVQRELIWEWEVEGVGSGIIVNPNGYILTNSHVVGDGKAKKISVLFENGDMLPGKLLWYDKALDLAVVKVEATGLPVADLGDSDSLEVGQLAVAIGNPLGLDFQRTVTAGIISGLNRSIRVDEYNIIDNLIQTDASINPGNSGGPLLNNKGEVIGINTVKIKSSAAEGLGFAIPINVVKPIIEQIVEEGDFKIVYLGVAGIEVERYERQIGVELSVDKGVILLEIDANSPADKAGLRPGDILVKMDNQEIESMNQLKKMLYKYKKGDKANLTIIRNGKEMSVSVVFNQMK